LTIITIMYTEYWGLTDNPFAGSSNLRWFFESSGHEECLSRLLYVVEQRRICGTLFGPAGVGKTLVLRMLASESRRISPEVALIDLGGHSATEFLWDLLAAWRLAPSPNETAGSLWRRVNDHVRTTAGGRASPVIICDHADRAPPDCLDAIVRLQQLASHGDGLTSLIVASRNDKNSRQATILADISELKIELAPLDRAESRRCVETLLARAGATRPIFDSDALDELFHETLGVPRDLCRLCDVVLLTGMSAGVTRIDARRVGQCA
jgi:general secretion pathway protein A